MSDQMYFARLIELAKKGQEELRQGRRAGICRKEIVELVERGEMWHMEGFGHTLITRIAQVLAILCYALAVALMVLALTLSVECVVGGLPSRMWLVYAAGALAALLLGIVAHTVYDKM